MTIYLLCMGKHYPEKLIAAYDHDRSVNCYDFFKGKILDEKLLSQTPIINFKVKRERLQRIDCLAHSGANIPLVNQRILDLLSGIAPDDFQLVKPQLNCLDGELEGYYLLNITHTIHGIDHRQSICERMPPENFVYGFKHLVALPNCMGQHHLAREAEACSELYVSQTVVDTFAQHHIKGCQFHLPEEYHRSFHNF